MSIGEKRLPHKVSDSRQSAVADRPKRFVNQQPLRSIEFQIPLPPVADECAACRPVFSHPTPSRNPTISSAPTRGADDAHLPGFSHYHAS